MKLEAVFGSKVQEYDAVSGFMCAIDRKPEDPEAVSTVA